MKKALIGIAVLTLGLTSCTDNIRARAWGGTAEVELPQGQKLEVVTWKDADIWYLTRPMREGEVAETYNFQEESSWGMVEGTIIIKETK